MNYAGMFSLVKKLPFDKEVSVCNAEGIELFLFRPSKLSSRFKDYDVKKNFQLWLREGKRRFRPNHLRVMIDLNLRTRARADLKEKLLTAFDSVFYGEDPAKAIANLKSEEFEHFLNPLLIIATLSQLFIIEQAYGYHKESKFEPRTLFYQGWIREFIDSPKEIDNLCMSVAHGQPPIANYTQRENKKHKSFDSKLRKLWYLTKN